MPKESKFAPENPKYKKVADLPKKHREEFADVESGFVKKEILEEQKKIEAGLKTEVENIPGALARIKQIYGSYSDEYRRSKDYYEEKERTTYKDILHERALKENKELKTLEYFGDGREAAATIKSDGSEGIDGLKKVLAELASFLGESKQEFERNYDERSRNYGTINHADLLIGDLMRWRRDENKYGELIDALADEIVKADKGAYKFQRWSHDLCHRFEEYEHGKGYKYSSLLNFPYNVEAKKKLINESVERAAEYGDLACVPRILGPLADYNIDDLKLEKLDGDFPLKPDTAATEKLAGLLQPNSYEGPMRHFLRANTPREFIVALVNDGFQISKNPERVVSLLEAVKGNLAQDKIDAYLEKYCMVNNKKITLEELENNVSAAESAAEAEEGLFVDVEGTLIVDGKLNEDAVEGIERVYSEGGRVVIFTGGNPAAQTEGLRKLGFPEKFLPVVSKNSFRGKVLELLFDDTAPEYQGFKAKKHELPSKRYLKYASLKEK